MTHADWLAAKGRRDNAAYFLAKAYTMGRDEEMRKQSEKFMAAEAEMRRLELELDGRGSK